MLCIQWNEVGLLMMTGLETVAAGFGLNIASNAIWDLAKKLGSQKGTVPPETVETLVKDAVPGMRIDQVKIFAEKIVELLSKGQLDISASAIQGLEVKIASESGGSFTIRDQSHTSTPSGSSIGIPQGGSITGTGKSSIHQDKDGNITFNVG